MWYQTLTDSRRESLFATMREIDDRAMIHSAAARRLEAPHTIAVGAGAFDEVVKAEVLWTFLRGLRHGLTPDEARSATKEVIAEIVNCHNAKRPKDINWQRWTETGLDSLNVWISRINSLTAD